MHGFLIDRNAPWRLVANLESRKMAQYMSKYGIQSLEELFDTYYAKTYLDDIEGLKEIMYAFYSFYIRVDPAYEQIDWCPASQKVITRRVRREKADKDSFLKNYGNKFWMRIWFIMRLSELGIEISDKKTNTFLTTAYKIQKTLDLTSAMDYLNSNLMKLSGRGAPPSRAFIDRNTDRQMIIKK